MDTPFVKPHKPPGCSICGLIGCKCNEVSDTFSATVCKKCRSDPCTCNRMVATVGVCSVCHRSLRDCICKSHVPVVPISDSVSANASPARVQRPYTQAHLEWLVNEGMNHYYGRDAEGLQKWLRRVLP